jgi:hypothetical protein
MRAVRRRGPHPRANRTMKKSLVINPPREGRSAATLVTHVYDTVTKRTKTIYLGSLSVWLDPASIPAHSRIPPGGTLHGIRLSPTSGRGMEPEDLTLVRAWLEAHGSHRRLQAREEERRRADAGQKSRELDELRREIEQAIRPMLEQQVRTAVDAERRAAELPPLEGAIKALELAGEYLIEQSSNLRARGDKVSNIRRAASRVESKAGPLDHLQAKANFVRAQSFKKFEQACKDAGVMAKRAPRSKNS